MKSAFETTKYEVISKEEIAQDTFLFRLGGNFPFKPGQFLRVNLPHFGEIALAPCSDPRDKKFFEICVRRAGSTSSAITGIMPGEYMEIRGPFGNSWPLRKLIDKDIILLAGGMGLVPLRPLLFELIRNKLDFGKITLIAGAKNSEGILFKDDLRKWMKKISLRAIAEYITDKDPVIKYEKGLVTVPLQELKINAKKTITLLCGPEIMYKFCNQALAEKGIRDDQIFASFERRMECGIGICQHCNIGKFLVCKDGPVFSFDQIKPELNK